MTRHPNTGADGVRRPTAIRLDPDLLAQLERDAQNYGRTISQSIRWHLRRSLELDTAA